MSKKPTQTEPTDAVEPQPIPEAAPAALPPTEPYELAACRAILPADFFPDEPLDVRLRNWTAAAVIAENTACRDIAFRNRNTRIAREIECRIIR
jgi:hypothetical protein